jgi:hypothetical protein
MIRALRRQTFNELRALKSQNLRAFPSGFSAFLREIDPVVLPVAWNSREEGALGWDTFMRA